MHDLTPISSSIGGAILGLAASLLLLSHGKIAGISGIYGGLFRRSVSDRTFRIAFILGLVLAGVAIRFISPDSFASAWVPSAALALGAGAVVGFGTQLGNGCTSGHGVCGLARFSVRSLVATMTFMASGMVTVFIVRHLVGAP